MKRRVYRNTPRSRAALAFTLLVASALPIAAPHAQTEDADTLADLKACAAIERSNARLACYDGVLGRAPSPQEPAAPTAVSPSNTAGPAAAPFEPAPGSVAAAGTAPGVAAAAVPEPETSAAPLPARAQSAIEDAGAGAAAASTIVVVEVRLRTPSSAVFVTASGEVFEQIDTGRGRYPEVPFEAKIEGGSLGSRFLVSPAGGPRIRVKLRR